MRSEPARRPKPDDPDALEARIAKLVVRILAKAAHDAHERTDDVWRDFKQA